MKTFITGQLCYPTTNKYKKITLGFPKASYLLFIYFTNTNNDKKPGNHTKANKSGEEAQKRNHGAYRYWAPSE